MNLWLTTLIIVAAVAVAVTAMYFVRRRAPEGGFFTDSDRAAAVFGVIGTAFAVLLAFVIFLAFDSYVNAKSASGEEADATLELYATTRFFASPARDELRGELICYSRAVVDSEWPAMKHRHHSDLVDAWVERLEAGIANVELTDQNEAIAYEHWFEKDAVRQEARRTRLAEANAFVPGPLWIILLMGGGLVLVYLLAYADSKEPFAVQALMVGSVTAVFVASLTFVFFLDHPYENTHGSIQPVAMRETIDQIARMQAHAGDRVVVPCGANGRPAGAD
jgi:hypothetical protein